MTFSIIIPCYNVAPFLRETLESVLAQTYTDWECICVNDGSTDDTATILDAYAARDVRFRVIHKANAGVSAARNDAIKSAKGNYVCFIDGDDVWDPAWLAHIAAASDNGRADIVRMAFTFWRNEREKSSSPQFDVTDAVTYVEGADNVFSWGWQTYTTDGYIWLNAVKRAMLIENQLFFPVGMKINEDIIFNLTLLSFSKCVAQSSFAGYFYRMRSTSAWHSKRPIEGCTRYIEESIRLWEVSRDRLERLPCIRQVRRNEAFMFYCSILQWFEFGLSEERERANEIARLLQRAARLRMLDLRAIPIYWRPAFWVAMWPGSFTLVWLTFAALDFYHRIHKRLAGIGN